VTLTEDARFYTELGALAERSIQREFDKATPAQEGGARKEAPRGPSPVRICPECHLPFVRFLRGPRVAYCAACRAGANVRRRYLHRAIRYKRRQGAFMGQLRRTA
jgi:hypothetical protein